MSQSLTTGVSLRRRNILHIVASKWTAHTSYVVAKILRIGLQASWSSLLRNKIMTVAAELLHTVLVRGVLYDELEWALAPQQSQEQSNVWTLCPISQCVTVIVIQLTVFSWTNKVSTVLDFTNSIEPDRKDTSTPRRFSSVRLGTVPASAFVYDLDESELPTTVNPSASNNSPGLAWKLVLVYKSCNLAAGGSGARHIPSQPTADSCWRHGNKVHRTGEKIRFCWWMDRGTIANGLYTLD